MVMEETVARICGETWREAPLDEREGAYGVALMIAFLEGSRPTFDELVRFLDLQQDEVVLAETAYRRMQLSGLFSMKFNARRDRCLQGYSSAQDARTAWCHVAGIASGWIGEGYRVPSVDVVSGFVPEPHVQG